MTETEFTVAAFIALISIAITLTLFLITAPSEED